MEEAAVCLHFARKLLLEQGEWDLGAFQAAWKAAVPEVGGCSGVGRAAS